MQHNTILRPIDLRAPGAIAQLLDWRRSLHGDLRMETGGDGGGTGSGGDGGSGGGSGSGSGDGGSTYTPPATQADFDKAVSTRLAQQARNQFGDYNDLKAKAAELDTIKTANASEIDKAKAAAKKEGATEATSAAHNVLRSAEARVQLTAAGAHNVADSLRLLDLQGIKVGDDGTVDEAAVKAAVETLKTSSAYLFGDGKKPSENEAGGGSGSGSAKDAGIGAGGGSGAGAGDVFGKSRLANVERKKATTTN